MLRDDCAHRLRLCHLKLDESAGDDGASRYGFTLNSGTTSSTGQFIGDVEHQSAAERAGLRSGDRVVEVNGVNVETDTHSEVQRSFP